MEFTELDFETKYIKRLQGENTRLRQLREGLNLELDRAIYDLDEARDVARYLMTHNVDCPSYQAELIESYLTQCLQSSFSDSGFALQDIVNEVGHRLGFRVENGRYRGTKSASR